MIRSQFKSIDGAADLAMLAAPTADELSQLKKAVAIMTQAEKDNADNLSDEQMLKIADDAGIAPAVVAIFLNGYALACKRVS